jgi:hypothetical protein
MLISSTHSSYFLLASKLKFLLVSRLQGAFSTVLDIHQGTKWKQEPARRRQDHELDIPKIINSSDRPAASCVHGLS